MQTEEGKRDPVILACNIIMLLAVFLGGASGFIYTLGGTWKEIGLDVFYSLLVLCALTAIGCAMKVKHWNPLSRLRRR